MVKLSDLAFWKKSSPAVKAPRSDTTMVALDDLDPFAYSGQISQDPWRNSIFDGGKFAGGYGPTDILHIDYWTLRQRSAELFNSNLYARGLIRRLITNEINTGLTPEACPDENIIGVPEDSLNEWTETVENRFNIWAKNPGVCDWKLKNTFGAIQRIARAEALVSGDVLVVLRQSQKTKLPMTQLISGNLIRTPVLSKNFKLRAGHSVSHGVELDRQERVVAFWVKQTNGDYKRLPAFGEKSGRRIAWLVYGTDKRLDDLRGQPLLSLVLQSLKEIDRYRDSTQRKAVINSLFAMQVTKDGDKIGTLPIQGGAVRKDSATVTDSDGINRTFNLSSHLPGMVVDEMQTGEEIKLLGGQGTDEKFGTFESAVIQAVFQIITAPVRRLLTNLKYISIKSGLIGAKHFVPQFIQSG